MSRTASHSGYSADSTYSLHTPRRSPLIVTMATLGLLALAACGHDAPTTAIAEARIIVVSVNGQSGIVDSTLPVAFVVELSFLSGRDKLYGYDVHSLVQYETE